MLSSSSASWQHSFPLSYFRNKIKQKQITQNKQSQKQCGRNRWRKYSLCRWLQITSATDTVKQAQATRIKSAGEKGETGTISENLKINSSTASTDREWVFDGRREGTWWDCQFAWSNRWNSGGCQLSSSSFVHQHLCRRLKYFNFNFVF